MALPVKKFSVGAIQVAVWKNEAKSGNVFNTISLDRVYKDKNEKWKNTGSLRQGDLPKAILALQKAYEYLSLREPEAAEQKREMLAEAMA